MGHKRSSELSPCYTSPPQNGGVHTVPENQYGFGLVFEFWGSSYLQVTAASFMAYIRSCQPAPSMTLLDLWISVAAGFGWKTCLERRWHRGLWTTWPMAPSFEERVGRQRCQKWSGINRGLVVFCFSTVISLKDDMWLLYVSFPRWLHWR